MAVFDLWKILGYEDKEKDRESARKVKAAGEMEQKSSDIQTTAARKREQQAYDTAHQRFVNNQVRAMDGDPSVDQTGLADKAEQRWAQQVAAEGLTGVKKYVGDEAEIPGIPSAVKAKQSRATTADTVAAKRDTGKIPGAELAGEAEQRGEFATNEATTATAENVKTSADAKKKWIAPTADKQAEGIFKDADTSVKVNNALAGGAPQNALEMRDIARDQARAGVGVTTAQGRMLGNQSGILSDQLNSLNATSGLRQDASIADIGAQIATSKLLQEQPFLKYLNAFGMAPGYDPGARYRAMQEAQGNNEPRQTTATPVPRKVTSDKIDYSKLR